jgi:hypothetical protein
MRYKDIIFLVCLGCLLMAAVHIYGQNDDLFNHEKKIEKKQKDYNKLDRGWNLGLSSELTITQTSYHNWEAGGVNVFVWNTATAGTAIYDTTAWNWATESKIRYGQSRQNSKEPRKTDDLIDFESVVTHKNNQLLNPYASVNFNTQMSPGYRYSDEDKAKISDFFDPAFLFLGLGVGFSPSKTFRTRIGLASRTTFTNHYNDYADGQRIKWESGLQWITHVERRFFSKLLIRSRLKVFSAFTSSEKTNIDWDNLLQLNVLKYLVINFQTYVLYQPEILKRTQLKEVLSIGLRYSFI